MEIYKLYGIDGDKIDDCDRHCEDGTGICTSDACIKLCYDTTECNAVFWYYDEYDEKGMCNMKSNVRGWFSMESECFDCFSGVKCNVTLIPNPPIAATSVYRMSTSRLCQLQSD